MALMTFKRDIQMLLANPVKIACVASGGGGGGGTSSLFRATDGARSGTDGVECAD